jgi:Flp pilus assembly protein TadG
MDMRSTIHHLRLLGRSEDGATLTEFGLIAPVLFLLLIGAFEVGHTLYMQSVLEGAVQKAARDGTLETAAGTSDAARDTIDNAVRSQILKLNNSANITITRRFYRSFTDASQAAAETFTDTASGPFADGICNNNEPFDDKNNNGVRDVDGGDAVGAAGAKDDVVYTVTVSYPNIFPLQNLIGGSGTTTLSASTVLANQPYGDQASYGEASVGHCA